jgi:molecular chaperone HtpG
VDTVDEFMLQYLTEFDGKKLKSVGKGEFEVGTEAEKEEAKKELEGKQEEFQPLIDFLQKELDAHVKQVRLSSRLTTSPVCLVVEDNEYSPMLERALRKVQESTISQKRVMELNPKHPLILRMQQRQASGSPGANADAVLTNAADLLWGLALLAEGSELPEPAKFSRAATEVLGQVV